MEWQDHIRICEGGRGLRRPGCDSNHWDEDLHGGPECDLSHGGQLHQNLDLHVGGGQSRVTNASIALTMTCDDNGSNGKNC